MYRKNEFIFSKSLIVRDPLWRQVSEVWEWQRGGPNLLKMKWSSLNYQHLIFRSRWTRPCPSHTTATTHLLVTNNQWFSKNVNSLFSYRKPLTFGEVIIITPVCRGPLHKKVLHEFVKNQFYFLKFSWEYKWLVYWICNILKRGIWVNNGMILVYINTKCIIKTLLKKMIQRSEQYKNCSFFISCYALSFITGKKLCSIVFTYKIKPTTSSVWPINDITEPIEWVSRYTHGVILLHIPAIVYYINTLDGLAGLILLRSNETICV